MSVIAVNKQSYYCENYVAFSSSSAAILMILFGASVSKFFTEQNHPLMFYNDS